MLKYTIKKISNISNVEYEHFYSHLSELSTRIDAMIFYEDRLRSVCAYYTVKEMAAKEFNISIDDLKIVFTNCPKPHFNNKIHFNISHSYDYIACVISDKPVGIDIEKICHINLANVDYAFSEDEIAYIKNFDNHEKDKRLCQVWTSKEAYQKLLGVEWLDFKKISTLKIENKFTRCYIEDYIVTVCSFYLS